jgi:hypothetical protein
MQNVATERPPSPWITTHRRRGKRFHYPTTDLTIDAEDHSLLSGHLALLAWVRGSFDAHSVQFYSFGFFERVDRLHPELATRS